MIICIFAPPKGLNIFGFGFADYNIIICILVLVIIIAVITNPNQDRHKEVIKAKITTYIQKAIKPTTTDSTNEWEQAGQAIGLMLGGVMVDQIINNLISTDNYLLFSTTKITWEGQTKTIGIGAFGNVYITKKLDEALDQGLMNNK